MAGAISKEKKQRRDKTERGGGKKLGKTLRGCFSAVQVVKGIEWRGEGDEGERKHKPSSQRTQALKCNKATTEQRPRLQLLSSNQHSAAPGGRFNF